MYTVSSALNTADDAAAAEGLFTMNEGDKTITVDASVLTEGGTYAVTLRA